MLNLTKIYNQLLEISHLGEHERNVSLSRILKRDIEENASFKFRNKMIRPVKGEEPELQILFRHLTTHTIDVVDEETQVAYKKRIFEIERSRRIHWIKHHVEEKKKDNIDIFSIEERTGNKNVIRTYILDHDEKYVVILEPYRNEVDYYLITAYYLESNNYRRMKNKIKNKLSETH